jgi:two-component system sensor histidine kinase AlgZ
VSSVSALPPSRAVLFVETWRALFVPRRLIALSAVAIPLVAAQRVFGGRIIEVCIAAMMVVSFLLLGPASWRALFSRPSRVPAVLRLLAYASVGVVCVFAFGLGVARALDIHTRFLTSEFSLLISCAFFWVGGFGLGRDIDMELDLARQHARSKQLAKEAEQARLLALKSHLDPHFVFNTLNAIAEWCRTDGEVAERAILQLSDILRAVLAGVRSESWSVEKERKLLESLAALHQMRDAGLFTLDLRVQPGADDVQVPPLLLMPLVENAVKHGPAAGHRGVLLLSFAVDARGLVVVVENPGPFKGRRAGGEGIAMVESRLALFTDDRGTLTLEDVGGRTRATLVLPLPHHGRDHEGA